LRSDVYEVNEGSLDRGRVAEDGDVGADQHRSIRRNRPQVRV
jgi:hypothetical protein